MNYRYLSIVDGRLVKFRPGMPHNRTVPSSAAHAISRKRRHIREAADGAARQNAGEAKDLSLAAPHICQNPFLRRKNVEN